MSILAEVQRVRKLAETNAEIDRLTKPDSFTDVMSRVMGREYKPLTQATPYEEVEANWKLPFPLYPFQVEAVNELGPLERSGLYLDPGCGKTATATAMTLFKFTIEMAERAIVIMPPILLDQWARFLATVPGTDVMVYRGTPATRRQLKLGTSQFTLVGAQIFKRDFSRFCDAFDHDTVVIRDEAHDIKNVGTDNYKKWTQFTADKQIMLLTGTPLSSPEDAYAFVKQLAPSVYRTKGQFLNIHAGERDFFNQIISWKNLDVLAENMTINAHRVLKEDVLRDLPEVTYTPIFYQLEPGHAQLYRKLAEEQLLQIGDGKLDATSTSKLTHALGQIVCNYDYFSGDPTKRSTCYDIIDQTMEELEPSGKLVIFAKYRMTNRSLLKYMQKYNAVAAFGDQTATQNRTAADYFIGNPECRAFIVQPTSGGVGLDGLQDVCRDGLFLELPSVRDFNQAVARLHRAGQKNGVHIRIATADGTLQVRQMHNMLAKDELVNTVIRNKADLRSVIFGD